MAVIRCKMCGGDLVLMEGQSVAECEYCGSRQTVPAADNEKKLTLFARAGRLRAACEFDKAAGIYETIVADFPEEAEAYWGLVLCKYGIEYVDDPGTGKKIPTCHRSSFESLMEDTDFEQALENADSTARRVYREEAKQIEQIRKGIIAVSANEQPYDIFICYKETDENGDRTLDSVLAQDIYDALTGKGYRVFFARITLEDKLGVEYEPYIFAALNSAKIMLAVGTDYEFYNAVWVKNEWSRYLKLMTQDKNKHLIPCYKGIDVYDMPREFAKLQAQDLGKMGAIQDILRGVEKLLPHNTEVRKETGEADPPAELSATQPLLRRAFLFLEDGAWEKADEYCEKVLDMNPECAEAYLVKLLAELHVHKKEELADCTASFAANNNYQKALRFADPVLRAELDQSLAFVKASLEVEKNAVIENGVLKKYSGNQERVVIPKRVKTIEKTAFEGCRDVTSVEIPDSVTEIASGAFAGCENLTSIRVSARNQNFRTSGTCLIDRRTKTVLSATRFEDIPTDGSIRCIGAYACYHNDFLVDIQIPEGVAEIGEYAFFDCCNLHTVVLPDSIIAIAATAIPRNPGVQLLVNTEHPVFRMAGSCLIRKAEKTVVFGTDVRNLPTDGSVEKIGPYAFFRSEIPESMVLPECISEIGENAFSECKEIASVTFYGKKLEIADNAFGSEARELTIFAFEDSDAARWAKKNRIPTRENEKMKRISTAALLSRGNQALKIGEWSQAAGFFEGVLRNDPRNAQAYLGKALVQEQCRSLDTLVRQRSSFYRNVREEKLYIKEDLDHILEIAEKYSIPGYVDGNEIRKLYVFDRSYSSEVSGRKQQYLEEKSWWQNNRQLSSAVEFAEENLAEQLQSRKKEILSHLSNQVRLAQETDAGSAAKVKAAYDAHIAEADKAAEQIYLEGCARREQDYRDWQAQAGQETDPKKLKNLAENFAALGDYQDSGTLAEECRRRAAEEQEKITAEKKRQRAMAAEKKKARRRRFRPILAAIAVITAACILLTGPVSQLLMHQWLPEYGYRRAEKLFAEGQYEEAIEKYKALGDYADAAVRASEIRYLQAEERFAEGRYQEAMAAFASLDNFKDSATRATECELTELASQGIRQAAIAYYKVGNRGRSMDLWRSAVLHKTVSAGMYHTVGLKTDGTVLATGRDLDSQQKALPSDGQTQVQDWRSIISVAAGLYHTVGLRENGTVVATGLNDSGQCNVSGWTDIVAVAAGDNYTAGLRADGTVVIAGKDVESAGNWRNVIEIAGGRDFLLGLLSDQTTVSTKGSGFGIEEDVISIAAAQYYLCLKEDGSVVGKQIETNGKKLQSVWAGGYIVLGILEDGTAAYKGGIVSEWSPEESEKYNLEQWDALKDSDIAAFAAGIRHAVLLKQDGTVTAFGENDFGGCNVKNWEDIQIPQLPETDFSLDDFLADLRAAEELSELVSEGKVKQAAMGYYRLGYQEKSLELWNQITDRETISAGIYHTVGLRNDGTVVAAGSNWDAKKKGIAVNGQCDVGSWEKIVDIEAGDYHTVGLKADGTVVATGLNTEGQCDVSDWSGIVSVAAGYGYTAGLKADGTVLVAGREEVHGASTWTDIISLAGGDEYIIGLKVGGNTISTKPYVIANRENVAKIAAGAAYVFLFEDRTVSSPYVPKGTEDIVDVFAGSNMVVCKQSDGTLITKGAVNHYFFNYLNHFSWEELERRDVVAFSGMRDHAVVLHADGTAVAYGENLGGRCDVDNWTDIRIPRVPGSMDGSPMEVTAEDTNEAAYLRAEACLANGEILKAAMAFGKLGDYADSGERSLALWNAARTLETISAGQFRTMAVQNNGTMLSTDSRFRASGITQVSDGSWHYAGLRSNGTVVADVISEYPDKWQNINRDKGGHSGQCDVDDWRDMVQVSAGDMHTLGLRKNGTVIGAGINDFGRWQTDTWQNIVAVSAGYDHSVGLHADGHVFTVGGNKNGVADTTLWKNIVAVSAGKFFTVGLQMDGTVIASGNNDFGQCDVSAYHDIVAVSAGNTHTVALRLDGTVVAVGGNEYGQCDVSSWRNIVAIDAGGWHTVGLKSDGTMVAAGHTGDRRCDVAGWKGIKLPAVEMQEFPSGWTDGKLPEGYQKPMADLDYEAEYVEAEKLLAAGKTAKAAIAFGKLGDYEDARERSVSLWDQIAVRDTIAVGRGFTLALKTDGTVYSTEGFVQDGMNEIENWSDIIAVSACGDDYAGLKADGTVVVAGGAEHFEAEIREWNDIVAVSAGHGVMGLKSDGTVVAALYRDYDFSDWTEIIAIENTGLHNGTGGYHAVGLKVDGTVVAENEGGYYGNRYGQCDVEEWSDIVKISADTYLTLGLKADGTVVATGLKDKRENFPRSGWEYRGQDEVSDWTDIRDICADGYFLTIGVKKDGSVVAAGRLTSWYDPRTWTDIVAVAAGEQHAVGLKSDGTLEATGQSTYGRCDVSEWTDIKLPN